MCYIIILCMNKFLISIFSFLVLNQLLFAEVKIKPEDHLQNNDNGLCGWCSLETLGRTHGWKQIRGLVASKTKPAVEKKLVEELELKNIKCELYNASKTEWWYFVHFEKNEKDIILAGFKDKDKAKEFISKTKTPGIYWIEDKYFWKTDFLFNAVNKDLGVAVTVKDGKDRHMFVVTNMDEKVVKVVDSNFPPGEIRIIPIKEFLESWIGIAIVIEKP